MKQMRNENTAPATVPHNSLPMPSLPLVDQAQNPPHRCKPAQNSAALADVTSSQSYTLGGKGASQPDANAKSHSMKFTGSQSG